MVCVEQNGLFSENSKSHHFSQNRIQFKTKFTVKSSLKTLLDREREDTELVSQRDGKGSNRE